MHEDRVWVSFLESLFTKYMFYRNEEFMHQLQYYLGVFSRCFSPNDATAK